MNVDEAIQHFTTGYDLCKKLGINSQNFYKWKKADWIPLKQQLKINALIGNILPIDIDKDASSKRISQQTQEN